MALHDERAHDHLSATDCEAHMREVHGATDDRLHTMGPVGARLYAQTNGIDLSDLTEQEVLWYIAHEVDHRDDDEEEQQEQAARKPRVLVVNYPDDETDFYIDGDVEVLRYDLDELENHGFGLQADVIRGELEHARRLLAAETPHTEIWTGLGAVVMKLGDLLAQAEDDES